MTLDLCVNFNSPERVHFMHAPANCMAIPKSLLHSIRNSLKYIHPLTV